MLAGLRDTLDKVVPKVKETLTEGSQRSAEVRELMDEIGETEAMAE